MEVQRPLAARAKDHEPKPVILQRSLRRVPIPQLGPRGRPLDGVPKTDERVCVDQGHFTVGIQGNRPRRALAEDEAQGAQGRLKATVQRRLITPVLPGVQRLARSSADKPEDDLCNERGLPGQDPRICGREAGGRQDPLKVPPAGLRDGPAWQQ